MRQAVGEDGGRLYAEVGDIDGQACPHGKNWRGRDHGSIIVPTVGLPPDWDHVTPALAPGASVASALREAISLSTRGSLRHFLRFITSRRVPAGPWNRCSSQAEAVKKVIVQMKG